MNYTDVMGALKKASLFDLFRLSVAISHELQNPERIKAVRQAFKVNDTVTFFDETMNAPRSGVVIEKNIKYVSLLDSKEQRIWKVLYCFLNLENVNTDIDCQRQEKLSKNNLRIGDCVGFNKDGEQVTGVITRLNYKTVSIVTVNNQRWRASYGCLYRIIDAELVKRFAELNIID